MQATVCIIAGLYQCAMLGSVDVYDASSAEKVESHGCVLRVD
jgi:hypothetical protein